MEGSAVSHAPLRDRLREAVRFARLAPSTHNAQPWTFGLWDDGIDVFADRNRSLPAIDSEGRELVMSLGVAVDHLHLALAGLQLEATLRLFPDPADPDHVARLDILGERAPRDEIRTLFSAIPLRRTYRGPLAKVEVPDEALHSLQQGMKIEGLTARFVRQDAARPVLVNSVSLAAQVRAEEPSYRHEDAAWVRLDHHATDGVPAEALEQGWFEQRLARLRRQARPSGMALGRRDARRLDDAPLLAVLLTPGDTPQDWLNAGLGLSRLVLQAAVLGISAAFYFQPIAVPTLREEIRQAIDTRDNPQTVIRLGYAVPGDPTPRRPLEDVLVETTGPRRGGPDSPEGGR